MENKSSCQKKYRDEILSVAHANPLVGHLGIMKTHDKVTQYFYWPCMRGAIRKFCQTCNICQVAGKPNQQIPKATLRPPTEEPFSRILVDCVGPLLRTKNGHKYMFTMMWASTRYPEAIPLRNISTKKISNALINFFTRMGLPKVIQSNQGSNFTSKLFREINQQLGIKHIKSSAYHPQSQGALERFHATLKTMLKTYSIEHQSYWDQGIPYVLFAV